MQCPHHHGRISITTGCISGAIALSFSTFTCPSWAQLPPDSTLRAESSVVISNATVQGVPTDLIESNSVLVAEAANVPAQTTNPQTVRIAADATLLNRGLAETLAPSATLGPVVEAAPLPVAQASPTRPDLSPLPPSREPLPEPEPLPTLPAPEDLLGPDFSPPEPTTPLPGDDFTIVVQRFVVEGSTIFTDADFEPITAPYRDRPITFEEILEVRDAISQLYLDNGYLTSGAIVPPQPLQDGVVQIQVIEGRVEDIIIDGTRRLQPSYVSSRLSLGTQTPLQVNQLLEKLQLLQLNPLVERISADLQAGTRPGANVLVVNITEADSFNLNYSLDNNRSPSVGSIRHQLRGNEGNLTGHGDALRLGYASTVGSQNFDASYTLPVSPRNTTVGVYFSTTTSDVIESPFDILEASSEATSVEITVRHPLIQTPTQELALGLVGSHQRTQTFLGIDDIGGFPLSAGADDAGRTKVTALRFFQEWTQRSTNQVVALRSQFSLGVGALDATVSSDDTVPDSQFLSWLGQGQWVRLLAPDMPLIVRGSLQLTPDPLLSLERYGLGGQATVRGYRQDALLTDNGLNASVEARFPIWRSPDETALLQITPFIDGGYGWNEQEADPDNNTLLSLGTGFLLQLDDVNFRLDWGIPLISRREDSNTLQEQGVYFTFNWSFF